MATQRHPRSKVLLSKLQALQAELQAAEAAEKRADQGELLKLIDRAGCLPQALAWARQKVAEARAK